MVMAKKEKMNKIICPSCGIDNSLDLNTCNSCKSSLKLNNKYYLIDVIGENNQITYLGKASLQEPQASDFVIIKELSIASLENWKNKELFEREISVLNSLNHRQIPKLVDSFELGGKNNKTFYLVMEYIEGTSLKDEISNKRYNEEEVLLLIEELLIVLVYLHSFSPQIVYIDIKPFNIIQRKGIIN